MLWRRFGAGAFVIELTAVVLVNVASLAEAVLQYQSFGDDSEIASAIADLASDGIRRNAWYARQRLRNIGRAAVPTLEAVLESTDYQQSRLAADLLSSIPGYKPTETLVDLLVEDLVSDNVRWNAVRAVRCLRRLGDAAVPALEKALGSPDYQQRQLAASLLTAVPRYEPKEEMLGVLVEGLKDDSIPQQRERWKRVSYIFVFNAADATAFLLEHVEAAERLLENGLESQDGQQRFLCAYILGRAGRTGAVEQVGPILVEHLRDNHIWGDACMSAYALAHLGPAVIPSVSEATNSPDKQQRETAELIVMSVKDAPVTPDDFRKRKVLQNISGSVRDPAAEYSRFDLKWGPWEEGARRARARERIQSLSTVEPLVAVINEKGEDPAVRVTAARRLGRISDPSAVEPLVAVLTDKQEDSYVRWQTALALGEIKDPSAAEPLLAVLNDKEDDLEVRAHAAAALGKMKERGAVEALIDALNDRGNMNRYIRFYAAWALGEIKDTGAVEALITSLADEHWEDKESAETALKKITGKDLGEDSEKWRKWWGENKKTLEGSSTVIN